MALTDLEKNFIYDYSVQLLQQDMLTNQLFGASSVGQDLRSLVLGGASNRAETFTNPFEEAISGKLRADADTTRQAAKNVGEASAMMGIAQNSLEVINEALDDMQDILDKVESNQLDGSSTVVQEDYDALRDKIIGEYQSAEFNGIYMLDSSKWDTDQISANGAVFIQSSNNGGFNINFHAIDDGAPGVAWTDLDGGDLDPAVVGGLADQQSYVTSLRQQMSIIEDIYESKSDSLESQVNSLESQAQIFDKAAQLRKPSDPNYSLEKLLADLVARELGTIVDSSG